MAEQVIEGTKKQLRSYFNKQSEEQRIKLIIVEEDEETIRNRSTTYPGNAVKYNGIPLLPTEGRFNVITMEDVKRTLDEEYEIAPEPSFSFPEDTVFFHGIPIIPKREGMKMLTLERVKASLEED